MKKYHKDYEKDGKEIRYKGNIYELPLEKGEKKRIFIKNSASCILYILLIILAGLVNNSGNKSFFLVLPYVCLFLPCAYMVMGVLSVPGLCREMERAAYDRAIGRIFRSAVGIFALSLYLIAADSVHLLRSGDLRDLHAVDEVVFLCACIAVSGLSCAQICHLQNLKKKVIIRKHDEGVPVGK